MSDKGNGNKTENKIISCVLDLLAQKGFYGFSVADIIKRCEIHKSSLYYHFISKNDIILTVVSQIHVHCTKEIFSVIKKHNMSSRENIRIIFSKLDHYFKNYHKQYKVMILLALELCSGEHVYIYQKVKDYFVKWCEVFFYLLEHCSNDRFRSQINDNTFVQFVIKLCLQYLNIPEEQLKERKIMDIIKLAKRR